MINRLQQSHALVILIADNLTQYMGRIRGLGEVPGRVLPGWPI